MRTTEHTIEALKEKIAFHKAEMDKYSNALIVIMELTEEKTQHEYKNVTPAFPPNSFASIILDMFNDEVPKTSRQLMDMYNKAFGKRINLQDFSGRLGPLQRKGIITKHTFPNNPTASKYYYGLPEWFNGNGLRQEYLDRIKKDEKIFLHY